MLEVDTGRARQFEDRGGPELSLRHGCLVLEVLLGPRVQYFITGEDAGGRFPMPEKLRRIHYFVEFRNVTHVRTRGWPLLGNYVHGHYSDPRQESDNYLTTAANSAALPFRHGNVSDFNVRWNKQIKRHIVAHQSPRR